MKLLNRSIKSYLLYSAILLLVSIPVFYLALQKVLLHSTDESLKEQLATVRSEIHLVQSEYELNAWKKLDWDISLEEIYSKVNDTLKTAEYFNGYSKEKEAFREISGNITVNNRLYLLTIHVSLVENEDLVQTILSIQVVLLVLLFTGMLLINRRISQKIWEPFYNTLHAVQQHELERGKSVTLINSKTDEFNDLNKAVTNLVERDLLVFRQQKEFIENASHEMQTPLAVFKSKLELLMQTEPLTEKQAGLIDLLNDTCQRLSTLNRSLLMLSKIENNQYAEKEQIELLDIIGRSIHSLQETMHAKQIHLTITFPGNKIIEANKSLIEILIINLLVNAIKYTTAEGDVNISFLNNALTVSNSAKTLEALDNTKLFTRFYKAGNEPGTGLGLAIAKNICTVYGYKLDYSFSQGFHNFHICFNYTA